MNADFGIIDFDLIDDCADIGVAVSSRGQSDCRPGNGKDGTDTDLSHRPGSGLRALGYPAAEAQRD